MRGFTNVLVVRRVPPSLAYSSNLSFIMLDRDKERLGVSSCTHDGEVSQTQIFSEPTGPTRIETHATHPTAPYGRLPVELLMMVKDNIPISDLRTHVCFYQTCRTVAAFYGDEDEEEEFWMKSWFNGEGWFYLPFGTKDPFDCDGYLTDEKFDFSNPYWKKKDHLLREHPLVLHSFASFPPVARLSTAYGTERELDDVSWGSPPPVGVYGAHEGVTIKHIVGNVLSHLDEELYTSQLRALLKGSFAHFLVDPHSMELDFALDQFHCLRGLWTLSPPWTGFDADHSDDCDPHVAFKFGDRRISSE
ncbi:hypothetical protein NLI96_g3791 [Meripilus lineatus]|uniref:Uncharacterized protein n=1 Tax=Meripilus lineatus TaxID=2056292 RepID=A0AAD5V638_9APHY|nr:hypothetical protein NLI96_g3791 [Physisporinus lineatus]